ncbi:MAG: hypothetical protein ACP5JU_00620 [Minisyncoccia bacterium]
MIMEVVEKWLEEKGRAPEEWGEWEELAKRIAEKWAEEDKYFTYYWEKALKILWRK